MLLLHTLHPPFFSLSELRHWLVVFLRLVLVESPEIGVLSPIVVDLDTHRGAIVASSIGELLLRPLLVVQKHYEIFKF
jgi:hypothetical protein